MTKQQTSLAFLEGGGEMSARMRAFDWARSPLGHPSAWPQSFRSVVGLLLNSKFPMFVAWGPELGFLYNDAYISVLGKKHPDALGQPFQAIWAEIWHDLKPLCDRALAGEATYWENLPLLMLRHGHEEQTWFTFSYSPVRDESDNIVGVFCACTETTEQVLGEQYRNQENARLHQLFEQAPGLMAVLREPSHIFELVNSAYLQLVGERDLVGKPVRDALPEVAGQGFYELLDRVFLSGEPYVGRGMPIKLKRKQNDELEERFVDFVFQPIKETNGKVGGIFVEGSDVTERHRTQIELQKVNQELADKVQRLQDAERRALDAARRAEMEQRRLDSLLEAAPVGIAMADITGRIVGINSANKRLWGQNIPAAGGMNEYRQFKGWWADRSERHGRPLAPHEWAIARALSGEEAPRDIIEIEPFDAPGTRRVILNSGAPIRTADGSITGAVIAQMDITDRVRAEEALREADRRKDEFLAMLAHELRNPLAPISAAAELLEMTQLNAERLQKTSRIISRQVQHMAGLVDDLLDVSRVTRGLAVLEKNDVDIKRIVSDAIEQVRPIIEEKGHHVTVETAPEAAHVLGDHKRLVQILVNLLNNAAKYTPQHGKIHLGMEVDLDTVMLCVKDNGIGIDPELQPHVFELFAQAQRTSDRSQGGLGIGLALVKSLVELHGGTVTCKSEGIEKGSWFTVELPLLIRQPKLNERDEMIRQLKMANKKLRILVVDDNADAAQMLAMYLEATGHVVMVEHDSQIGLEQARYNIPDICVLDIGLPGMDGKEMARIMRADPALSAITLIALTGYGQESDRQKAIDAGFDHYLVKPVDLAKLGSLLEATERA
jgi:PAS domain S-box-containing protein